ncbi:MAG: ABC transporter permease subunit [Alphaproteobacteria bacterium]|nr:ABC transporter permease subunit [Alphaproteobacteria bacterium]
MTFLSPSPIRVCGMERGLRPEMAGAVFRFRGRAWSVLIAGAVGALGFVVLVPLSAHFFPGWLDSGLRLDPARRLLSPFGGDAPRLWLGTDALGRNFAARLCVAAPNSLLLAFGAALLAVIPGAVFGALAATSRFLDVILMRFADALLTLPPLVLALALLTLSGPGVAGLVIALAVPEFPRVMRYARVLCQGFACEPWYEAARGLGLSSWRLLVSQMFPALLVPLAVVFGQVFAIALLVESLLGFLGLGLPVDSPGWGSLLAEGRGYLRVAPHLVVLPGLCIAVTIFSVQVLADSVRWRSREAY